MVYIGVVAAMPSAIIYNIAADAADIFLHSEELLTSLCMVTVFYLVEPKILTTEAHERP